MNWRSLIAILPSLSFLLLSISTEGTTGQEIVPEQTLSDRKQQTASQSICPSQLGTAIEAVTQRPEFARSRWGILIETLSTANQLYSRDAERYFIPASNVKLLVTAAALRQLSPEFRIRTSVYGTGTLPNLTSLRVVGRGDPSLTTAQLKDLAQQLKRQGVRQVQQLIVDDSYFPQSGINPTWEWEDIQYDYATSVTSLILNQNAVTLTLSPQQPGQPLRLSWNDTIAAKQWRVGWGFPWEYYAPLLRFAKTHQLPVLALNTPTEVSRKVARSGLESLTADEQQYIPSFSEIRTDNAEYRQRLQDSYEQHHQAGHGNSRSFERFFTVQVLWDETMAETIAEFIKANPDYQVVVLAGQGHIVYGYGIPSRVARRLNPELVQRSVLLGVSPESQGEGEGAIADYFWPHP